MPEKILARIIVKRYPDREYRFCADFEKDESTKAARHTHASSWIGFKSIGFPSYFILTRCGWYGSGKLTPACSIFSHWHPAGGSFAFHHKKDCMAYWRRSALSSFFSSFFAAGAVAFLVFLAGVEEDDTTLSGLISSRLRFFFVAEVGVGVTVFFVLDFFFVLLFTTRSTPAS